MKLQELENIILSLFEQRIELLDDILDNQDEADGMISSDDLARSLELRSMQNKIIDAISNYHTQLEKR